MSIVTITDSLNAALNAAPVTPQPQSAPVKYGQSPALNLTPGKKLLDVLTLPLLKAAPEIVSFGAEIGPAFNFGVGQPQFSIAAGPGVAIRVNAKKDADLFADDPYKSQVKVKGGEAWVSVALTGSATGKDSQTTGDITLGFDADDSITFEYFRRFQVNASSPVVGEALREVISNFIIPADVADLAALRSGDIAACSGKRQLKVSGDFAASVSAVPLATPNLPLADKPIQLNASAKLDVRGSYKIASNWQIRGRAVSDGVVELGFYKQQGSDWDIAVSASAGAAVGIGSTDLLTKLIDKLSGNPEADKKQVAAAGLKPDDVKAINEAIAHSIDHSVHASLNIELKGLNAEDAAFLYTVEPGKLNGDTAAAVTAALHGDLTAIGRGGPGITLTRSIMTRTEENGTTFKVNLIGVFNFLSLADFISKSQVLHEPISGDVVFSETASGQRIDVISLPQAQQKLRKLIFDSVLMTSTYRGAGALEVLGMECSAVHFALNSTTNEHTMSDYLDWFIALRLLDPGGKQAIMQSFHGAGVSTCIARVAFNDDACRALFLDNGEARKLNDYVSLGRDALESLPDAAGFRRDFIESDKIWAEIEGWTDIPRVMQKEQGWPLNDPRIQWLATDYKTIAWWADAMSSTADKIVDMRHFLQTADSATLETNASFMAKKNDVQKHVLRAVKNSPMSFDQPFGLVALYLAAAPAAVASGTLLSTAINREFGALAKTTAG